MYIYIDWFMLSKHYISVLENINQRYLAKDLLELEEIKFEAFKKRVLLDYIVSYEHCGVMLRYASMEKSSIYYILKNDDGLRVTVSKYLYGKWSPEAIVPLNEILKQIHKIFKILKQAGY